MILRTFILKIVVMVGTIIVKKSGTGVSVDVNQIYVNDYQFIWYSTILV